MPGPKTTIIAHVEQKYGLPHGLLWGVFGAETDFGKNLSTSGAGAQGPFQFMPATAHGMGIDPNNFAQAADGAGRLLKQYLSRGTAGTLAAYNAGPAGNANNPETRAYIPKVLALAKTAPYGRGAGHPPAVTATPISAPRSSPSTTTPGVDTHRAIIDALLSTNPSDAASGKLSLTSGLLGNVTQRLNSGSYNTSTTAPATKSSSFGAAVISKPLSRIAPAGGHVVVAPGANRSGVTLQPEVINAVKMIAGLWGKPLTIGTGTNHNQFVLGTSRQSDHWTGHAADIPMSGAQLTKLGQDAMRAFGQKVDNGGAHTFEWHGHRVQIIFNSMVGGNHFNHLHVGIQ